MNINERLNDKGPDDLEAKQLVSEKEAAELKKIIDLKDKAIEELTKKINRKLNNLREKGL
jgi:hypothetical protein